MNAYSKIAVSVWFKADYFPETPSELMTLLFEAAKLGGAVALSAAAQDLAEYRELWGDSDKDVRNRLRELSSEALASTRVCPIHGPGCEGWQ